MSAQPEPMREQRADARRNVAAILEAARTALAADPSASMGAIATAAGVHRATVHRHFPARDDLLAALHERSLQECLEALEAARAAGGPLGAVLTRVTVAFLEIGVRYQAAQWRPSFAPAAEEAEARTALRGPLTELFREAAAVGEIRSDVDPAVLAALWAGMIISAGQGVATRNLAPADVAADIMRLLAPR